MSGHAQPAEKSSLATVKRSKLVVLDAFDTASAAFVGKFMDVSYFTCLDDIANAIDDLIALEDIYVSATGDSDKPTVEPVALKSLSTKSTTTRSVRSILSAKQAATSAITSGSFPSLSL